VPLFRVTPGKRHFWLKYLGVALARGGFDTAKTRVETFKASLAYSTTEKISFIVIIRIREFGG
jgi:hypothetical protein